MTDRSVLPLPIPASLYRTPRTPAAQVAQSKILQAHELLGAAHPKLDIYHTRGTDPLKRLAATEAAREAKDPCRSPGALRASARHD